MSLREFIHQLRSLHEVEDIHSYVDTDTQLSAQIYARMQEQDPTVLLYHKLPGSAFSVVANLFATRNRLRRVLKYENESLAQRLENLPESVKSWADFSAYIKRDFACVRSAAQVFDPVFQRVGSLYDLPQIRYWGGDSSAYFSLPAVFTRAFDSGEVNAGIYRLTPLDSKTLNINWRRGSRAYNAWRSYADRGEKMPLTVVLGADPALMFASMFPLPDWGAELPFWGFIRGCAQPMQFNNKGLPLPTSAEILLEGYVDPVHLHEEGSFANHSGFYTESVPCPVMHVSRIRARSDAIMPITVAGPPPTESTLLGAEIWQLLFVLIRREIPSLVHMLCPDETAHLPILIVQVQAPQSIAEWKIQKRIILQHSILKNVHTLILVDQNTDITSSKRIYWHCMNLETDNFIILDSGMRVVDGVLWRFQGKRKVLCAP